MKTRYLGMDPEIHNFILSQGSGCALSVCMCLHLFITKTFWENPVFPLGKER